MELNCCCCFSDVVPKGKYLIDGFNFSSSKTEFTFILYFTMLARDTIVAFFIQRDTKYECMLSEISLDTIQHQYLESQKFM